MLVNGNLWMTPNSCSSIISCIEGLYDIIWATDPQHPELINSIVGIIVKTYNLVGPDGIIYSSPQKGTFGGHKKLKIYGTLNCPSARRWLDRGFYSENRVFFLNEEDAIVAGYRPCAVCLKSKYKEWKNGNS